MNTPGCGSLTVMMAAAGLSIEQAAEMLGVQPGLLQPFAVVDPFHDCLPLEGFLCHKTDHRYGAIVITRVADEPCPQLIHATPKLKYPFDRDGRFRFPPIARAHVYEKLDGTEGAVWCVTEPSGLVSLWKCKPESIEEIHWATGINKQAVLATCWNALETADELCFDTVRPLLLEEYQPDDVDAFRPHVEECIAAVRAELAFRERVLDAYRAIRAQGLSFPADKAAVMRLLAPRFTKGEMRRVYAALAAATG